ncbi:MAG: UDP-N-acetylmuramoyl-tripeptide--D-alanyl-D-alanine ligase [Chlamydiae bacterium]|nr:UDP-N-acetylmuramoyl-tripeptide--D-alanyl-D-alanine ligase [Chlamydiota bacterium]
MKPIPLSLLARRLGIFHRSGAWVHGAAIDSRLVQEKDLFFALPGERVSGVAFLEEAARKGASGAVVSSNHRGTSFGLPLLRVPDVLEALQDSARKSLEGNCAKIVAVTGSLGKTTVKHFAKALLETHFKVFASPSSYNSQATVPLSILNTSGEEEILILEMGMDAPGHIQKLLSIAPPTIALLTTISPQHVNHFPNGLEGIAEEKGSIFSHPGTSLGLLSRDIPFYDFVKKRGRCGIKTFSLLSKEADFFLEKTEGGLLLHMPDGGRLSLTSQLPNPVHYHNLLAALALAFCLDVPWRKIVEVVPRLTLPPMRFERVEREGICFINDAYNANPESMEGALRSLPSPEKQGRKVAILGDMNALGIYSKEGHQKVLEVASATTDLLLCIGERWKESEFPQDSYQHFATKEALASSLRDLLLPGDVVLLKGARVHALETLIDQMEEAS